MGNALRRADGLWEVKSFCCVTYLIFHDPSMDYLSWPLIKLHQAALSYLCACYVGM